MRLRPCVRRGGTARGGAPRAAADGAMGALGADDVAGSVRGGASKECGELGGAAHSAMFAVAPLDSARPYVYALPPFRADAGAVPAEPEPRPVERGVVADAHPGRRRSCRWAFTTARRSRLVFVCVDSAAVSAAGATAAGDAVLRSAPAGAVGAARLGTPLRVRRGGRAVRAAALPGRISTVAAASVAGPRRGSAVRCPLPRQACAARSAQVRRGPAGAEAPMVASAVMAEDIANVIAYDIADRDGAFGHHR
ncbi:hypothetical protein [Pseudofrankia saprophytica]|uniref:hypothetical protein n=1 Tax=Pseudofrankia saprophytica TaxID=298655 RepID=UPI000487E989|nr:hypothetical protein [Pseudofrankia saprophytica]